MKKVCQPLMRLIPCLILVLCAFTLSAFAAVDDDLLGYAQTLAAENYAKVGWKRDLVTNEERGDRYKLNTDSPSNGRTLMVLEVKTSESYTGGGHMDVSVFYMNDQNKVCWLDDFNFENYAKSFTDRKKALVAGQVDAVSFEMPKDFKRLLGVYFHKEGSKDGWKAEWLRIGVMKGDKLGPHMLTDSDGYSFVSYSGTYRGLITDLNELGGKGWGNHLWRFPYAQSLYETPFSTDHSQYILELVTGEHGFPGGEATIKLDYTDLMGFNHVRTIDLGLAFERSFPGNSVNPLYLLSKGDLTGSSWLDQDCHTMSANAISYVTNLYDYSATDTALLPYTSTNINLMMHLNININSISITPSGGSGSLDLQSVRLIRLTEFSGKNYWNAAFSRERLLDWKGTLQAHTTQASAINNNATAVYAPKALDPSRRLTTYWSASGPSVDNTGTPVAVSVQLADVAGAGVESLAAGNRSSYNIPKEFKFFLNPIQNQAGTNGFNAYWNMQPFRAEFMTLEVRYKDTMGDSRRVQIPFYTAYLCYLLNEFDGKFCSGKDADFTSWCAGLLQQNQNIGLPFRLAQYQELTSVKLTYGAAPEGMTRNGFPDDMAVEGGKPITTVNTSSDTIAVENICFYEGVTQNAGNFKTVYDSELLAPRLETSLTPAYHYAASSYTGMTLSTGSSITAQVGKDEMRPGAPKPRDYTDRYVVRIATADIETAGTKHQVTVSFNYTTNAGNQVSTTPTRISNLAEAYYGKSYRDASPDYQYQRHMRRNCGIEFMVEMKDLKSVDSVTLSIEGTEAGVDEWQIKYIEVRKLINPLPQRTGSRQLDGSGPNTHIYWERDQKEGADYKKMARADQSVLLHGNRPSKTIYFTVYDEAGVGTPPEQAVKNEQYLTALPSSMTFEEAKKDLGLSVVKYTYQISVEVASVEDSGSSNYFYFQLVFENGTSAVVLANQQLSSDSFRLGTRESFQIKTTQNYGNVIGVRIICDNTSSTSDVFDKLNIESITVTLRGETGISKSWLVERVGWIDITYVDEGAEISVNGINGVEEDAQSNVEVLREFPVTGTATAVDLLFSITTSPSSDGNPSNTYKNALGEGGFDVTLLYRDSDGVAQEETYSLIAEIKEYNDTDQTRWIFRPAHTDRFTLSLTDVRSIQGLILSRTGGAGTWKVDKVSIEQIGGLGEVYLSPALTEYMRDTTQATHLADSTNDAGVSYSVPVNGSATIAVTENIIDVVTQEDNNAWSASISRVPTTSTEELNIMLFPGAVAGLTYNFSPSSPPVLATVVYATAYGGTPVQNAFTLSNLGEVNGQTVLYGKGLKVTTMAALASLRLSPLTDGGDQPYIASAIVQRVRDGVLTHSYYFDFANHYLGNGSSTYPPALSIPAAPPMKQTLLLQPAAGQDTALTPESSDIAVALRYTSSLDPAQNKSVYQTPYVYLTDAGYASVKTGQTMKIAFDAPGIAQIMGLSVISSGAVASFDNAVVYNWPAAGDETATPLSTGYFPQSFTASTIETVLNASESSVVPALFRFTTAAEEVARGAGTSGWVDMTVRYTDNNGLSQTMDFPDLLSYLSAGAIPEAGSTVETTVLLNNAAYLEEISLTAADPWFLSAVSAQLTLPWTATVSGSTVNNWAGTESLWVDLLPDAYREIPNEGNAIQSFSVTGRSRNAGVSASAAAGNALLITAYPGDLVDLTPVVTAVGYPDTSWTWNSGSYEGNLTVQSDGTASFFVPHSMSAGESCTFSVTCNGDNRLTVSVTILVENEPVPEPQPFPPSDPQPGAQPPPSETGGDLPPEPEPAPEPDPFPDAVG